MNLNCELRPRRELLNPQFEGYKLNLDQLPLTPIDLKTAPVAVFGARPNEINYINLALYAQHQATFTDRWMSGIWWVTREQDGYGIVEYRQGKVNRLFDCQVPHEHALPTVHFPLDELYVIGNGNRQFTVYAKDQESRVGFIVNYTVIINSCTVTIRYSL